MVPIILKLVIDSAEYQIDDKLLNTFREKNSIGGISLFFPATNIGYIMDNHTFEIATKSMLGLSVTEEEKRHLMEYDAKYKIVRHIVMEKRKHEGFDLVDFQFTPGDGFMDAPILDLANGIIESFSSPAEALDFGDLTIQFDDDGNPIQQRGFGNPPHTGRQKKSLTDL